MTTSTTAKPQVSTERSLFADALARLLDRTEMFSRKEWAAALGVTPAAISQWVNDKTLPRAQTVRGVLDLVRRHSGADCIAVRDFMKLNALRAKAISPLGERMGPTMTHYLVAPLVESFLNLLETATLEQQEEVLRLASAECRRLRDAHKAISQEILIDQTKSVAQTTPTAQIADWTFDEERPILGRKTDVRKIRNFLSAGRPVMIAGAAGIGKTTVVGEAIRQFLGTWPCEAVHRFEFTDYSSAELTAPSQTIAREWETAWAHCSHHPLRKQGSRRDRSLFLVFEDIDLAPKPVLDSLRDLLGRLRDDEPQIRVLVTCKTPNEAATSWLRETDSHSRFADVHLSRLADAQIGSICVNSLTPTEKTWDDIGLQRAVWLSSGSPGYCRRLVSRLAVSDNRGVTSAPEIARVGMEVLQESPSGVAAQNVYDRLSDGGRIVALWSSLHDGDEAVDHSNLPMFYEEASKQLKNRVADLADAVAEANQQDVVESFEFGGTPVIRLKDESLRPHLKLLTWKRFGDSVVPKLSPQYQEWRDLVPINQPSTSKSTEQDVCLPEARVI